MKQWNVCLNHLKRTQLSTYTKLAELTAKLFGGFITTLIHQAAMARRTQKDFFEYLDEFQLFVSTEGGSKTFSRILAEARKQHLYLFLATSS